MINIIYKTSLDDGKKSLSVQGIEHYKSQEGNHAILRELRRDVLDNYDCFTVGETVMVDLPEAKLLCDKECKELDMLFYFEHLEIDRRIARFIPKKFQASKLLELLAKWQQGLQWNAVYLENHDQPRIVSHFGACKNPATLYKDNGEMWKRSAKLLALMELTLRGTPFIYQGQEIGMTNFDFKSLDEVNDVESHNLNKLMKKLHIPAWLRWRWIKISSRDNARTPMQWNSGVNAGFTTGRPWLGISRNYTRINYEAQKNDPDSVLAFYKKLIQLRLSSECLKSGAFIPVYADTRIMAYRRELHGEAYVVLLNFSDKEIQLSKKARQAVEAWISGNAVISNTGRMATAGSILPWEGIMSKIRMTK
ncbi:alpha-amylase family glycosyl hydrolase [Leadbettera azotonutricia]|uniref:alpha-amylase family glycosyl hydrolase n=1 Tax=Leadbettera azotonutricia TaxID=150829 RepID=UPI0006936889|nr:alpha-amylase family glycosyl hydrolase [Leadbettera azotonutricia]